jgi:hypothetical protein
MEVGVDSGMLLVIDPAYLFSEEEWRKEINPLAKKYGGNWPRAVLELLARRTDFDIPKLAVIVDTCGDGRFPVRKIRGGFQVDTSC